MNDHQKKKKRIFQKWCLLGFIGAVASVLAQSAMASPEQERIYLLQLLHQINAMQPTIKAAEKAQSPTARVQFHYTAYVDTEGRPHNGVWEDLQLIREGIQEQLDQSSVEPRVVEPISGDYRDDSFLAGNQMP